MAQQAVILSNSVVMPLVGYTAAVYKNETELGVALKNYTQEFGLQRKDLFITSKLGPKDHGYEACLQAFQLSLKKLQLDYLDLYLIHWPGVQKLQPQDLENRRLRNESWLALEHLHKEGKVRAIGVSNYNIKHLKDLLELSSVTPHVNQVEYHPHYQQRELKKYCDAHGIKLQAYSSLGTTVTSSPLLEDPYILKVSKKLCCTPAQVLLRWATQQDVGVLPKSTNETHIHENFKLDFDISEEDYVLINSTAVTQKYAWDSSIVL